MNFNYGGGTSYNTLNPNMVGSSINTAGNVGAMTGIAIWSIIALVLAVVGGILVYFLFVKAKTEPKGKFAKWLKNFLSFKIMWIEAFVKIFYYALTIFVILLSFSFLTLGGAGFLPFICTLVLGPIGLRIAYESMVMFIMIWRNTQDISDNTKKK